MRQLCYLICGFFIIASGTRAQDINYSVIYTASTFQNMGNKNNSSTVEKINAIMANTNIRFQLLINGNESLYQVNNELYNDEINTKIALVFYGATDKYYINLDDSQNVKQINAFGDLYLVPLDEPNWTLSNDTKMIDEYLCFKATYSYVTTNDVGSFKKEVIAWYTPKINKSFGPRGYYGLPGLILELRDDKLLFKATEIILNKKNNVKIAKPSRGRQISIEELDELGKKYAQLRRQ